MKAITIKEPYASLISNGVKKIETTLEGPLILNNLSYGTKDPKTISGAKEGQVYLWIQNEA